MRGTDLCDIIEGDANPSKPSSRGARSDAYRVRGAHLLLRNRHPERAPESLLPAQPVSEGAPRAQEFNEAAVEGALKKNLNAVYLAVSHAHEFC